jgi:mannose-6-phosphate isomerase-like protein (cupin superfamily)
MLIVELGKCPEFIAGDKTVLREVLHPGKMPVEVRYSLAHATVRPGERSLPHRLRTSEVYYILEGSGLMVIDGEEREVGPGSTVYIPPGAEQHIRNTGAGDLKFLCIVDPAWRAEDEEVTG